MVLSWLLLSQLATAETSKIIPAFLEASDLYLRGEEEKHLHFIRPDILAALKVLEDKNIDPIILEKYTSNKSHLVKLRADDRFDGWRFDPPGPQVEVPEIAVHAFRFKAEDISDEWLKDDVYAYFFITDGVIPTGKVTSIYKGIGRGQSFFFNEIDRAIFPLIGVPAKKPENHLIIDYGIIESDGDDIKEMQKLSSIIIDIAIAVYSSYDPQNAQILINLRKEIKALAELLLSMNHDDRLVTGTVAYKTVELEEMLRDESYVEVVKQHNGGGDFSRWDYKLYFRFLKK